jgi:hypothetical protein
VQSQIQYSQAFFLDLIPDYMEMIYPVQPVITESELRTYIQSMDTDYEAQSFIYAFASCTLNLTRIGDKRTEEVERDIKTLMNYSIETRQAPYAGLRSSVMRAMQSVFIHNSLMTMQASDAAFHYLRDAITAIQLLRVENQDIMSGLPLHERARRQRLYWQAFIHERFVAILDYRQAILPPLDTLPEDDPTIPISVHEGFIQIIKLFRLVDPEFLRNWLGSHGKVTCDWIEAKSRELEAQGEEESGSHGVALLSMMQLADLAMTREWLRTIVWRLAMSRTLLSSSSSKECLSLSFPVRLSQTLRQQVTSMSRDDIEVHGSSIVQKLFEITDTIADVLLHVPAATFEETALRIEDFLFILDFVLKFPTLDHTRRSILLGKLERLQSKYPEVCSANNSPNMPGAMQSPTFDPWLLVTQSKLSPENGGEPAAFESMESVTTVDAPLADPRLANQNARNNISKRLLTASFAQTNSRT